jgi:LPS sulfotransferase NodH
MPTTNAANATAKGPETFGTDSSFDMAPAVAAARKYLIMSTPRSGSTMLSSALHASGLAGAPFEYFHPAPLNNAGNPELYPNRLNLYFKDVVSRRTSPNGLFGMKLHFPQFERIFCANPTSLAYGFSFLREFDAFVLTYRRDKILQAISGLLARENNLWATTSADNEGRVGRPFAADDVVKISEEVRRFTLGEYSWRKIAGNLGVVPHEVAYEDLTENSGREFQRIVDYLDIKELAGVQLQPKTRKTTDVEQTLEMKRRYLKAIGAT